MIQKPVREKNTGWNQNTTHVFWGEIAPHDHLVQIYENENVILDSLEGFVSSGFQAGDSVVIIAIGERIKALDERLIKEGFDLAKLAADKRYIALNAHETLKKFMIKGWPDEFLFTRVIKEVVNTTRSDNSRHLRAYGEMVSILWGLGHNGATVQLEHLWNKLCEKEKFCLFCAYPKSSFKRDTHDSLEHICCAHTKLITGFDKPTAEVYYKKLQLKTT